MAINHKMARKLASTTWLIVVAVHFATLGGCVEYRRVDVVESPACRYSYLIPRSTDFEEPECQVSLDSLEAMRNDWSRSILSMPTVQAGCTVSVPPDAVSITVYCCDPSWERAAGDCRERGDLQRGRWYKSLPGASQKHDIIARGVHEHLDYFSFAAMPCSSLWCPVPNVSDPNQDVCSLSMRLSYLADGATGLYTCVLNRTLDLADDSGNFSAKTFLVQAGGVTCDVARRAAHQCYNLNTTAPNATTEAQLLALLSEKLQYTEWHIDADASVCLRCDVPNGGGDAYWTFSGASTSHRGVPLHGQSSQDSGVRVPAREGVSVCGDRLQFVVVDRMNALHEGFYSCMPSLEVRSSLTAPQTISIVMRRSDGWSGASIAATAVSSSFALAILVILITIICQRRINTLPDPAQGDIDEGGDMSVSQAFGRHSQRVSAQASMVEPPAPPEVGRLHSYALPAIDAQAPPPPPQPQPPSQPPRAGEAGEAPSASASPPSSAAAGSSAASSSAVSSAREIARGRGTPPGALPEWTPSHTPKRDTPGRRSVPRSFPIAPRANFSSPSYSHSPDMSAEEGMESDEREDVWEAGSRSRSDSGTPELPQEPNVPEQIDPEQELGRELLSFQFGGHPHSLPQYLGGRAEKSTTPLSVHSEGHDNDKPRPEAQTHHTDEEMVLQGRVVRSAPSPGSQYLLQRSVSPSIQQPKSRPSSGSSRRSRNRRSGSTSSNSRRSSNSASPVTAGVASAAAAAEPEVYLPLSPNRFQSYGATATQMYGPPRPASAMALGTFGELDDIFSECSNEHSGLHNPPARNAADAAAHGDGQRGRSFRDFFRNISSKNAGYRVMPRQQQQQQQRQQTLSRRPQSAPPGEEDLGYNEQHSLAAAGQSNGRARRRNHGDQGASVQMPPFQPGPEWQSSLRNGDAATRRNPPRRNSVPAHDDEEDDEEEGEEGEKEED